MKKVLNTVKLSPMFRSSLTWGTIKGILEEAGLSDTDVVSEIHIVSSDPLVNIYQGDDNGEKVILSKEPVARTNGKMINTSAKKLKYRENIKLKINALNKRGRP